MKKKPFEEKARGWCGDPRRGAQMGRGSCKPEDFVGRVHLEKVPLDGDYDQGGAYWGAAIGNTPPLFCAWDEEGNTMWLRAADRLQAMEKLPNSVKFFRREISE